MTRLAKPTYQELEQQIKTLEQSLFACQQTELCRQKELFEFVINSVPYNIFWKDLNSVYMGCNTCFAKEVGFKNPEEIIGCDDYDLISGKYADKYRADDKLVMSTGQSKLNYEETFLDIKGNKVWWKSNKIPLRNSDGIIIGVLTVAHNVTPKKLTEKKLLASNLKLEALEQIINLSPVIVWQWKKVNGWLVEYVSENVKNLGYKQEDFYSGKEQLVDLVHPDDVKRVISEVYDYAADPECNNYTQEYRLLTAEGKILYIYDFTSIIRIKKTEEISYYRSLLIDVTAQKMAEKKHTEFATKLKQSEKMESIGRLAGGVAHDFNNMLTVILGNTEMALAKLSSDNPINKNLEQIMTATKSSADLTRQLLAFASKQTVLPKILNLNETLEGMLKMLRRLIGENITILCHVNGSKIWPIKMDTSQIDQIVVNLCVNARDAIENVGKIAITTEIASFDKTFCENNSGYFEGDFVLLSVSDDGCGMDQGIIQNIFEPFFTTKKMGEGTGLGLATIHGIVNQNKGFIKVSSELGKGATFKIYLPRHIGEILPEESGIAIKPPMANTGETILIVEDDTVILDMAKMMLEDMGYTILTADSSIVALSLAEEYTENIDLLMTDVIMPDLNGKDLADKLKNRYPDTKLLFMSGYTDDTISDSGVLPGDIYFIHKPFSMIDIAMKVREVLDEK